MLCSLERMIATCLPIRTKNWVEAMRALGDLCNLIESVWGMNSFRDYMLEMDAHAHTVFQMLYYRVDRTQKKLLISLASTRRVGSNSRGTLRTHAHNTRGAYHHYAAKNCSTYCLRNAFSSSSGARLSGVHLGSSLNRRMALTYCSNS